jgi:hypothetical protein
MSLTETWERTPTITKALAIGTAGLYVHARFFQDAPVSYRSDSSGSVLLFGLGATALSAWLSEKPVRG